MPSQARQPKQTTLAQSSQPNEPMYVQDQSIGKGTSKGKGKTDDEWCKWNVWKALGLRNHNSCECACKGKGKDCRWNAGTEHHSNSTIEERQAKVQQLTTAQSVSKATIYDLIVERSAMEKQFDTKIEQLEKMISVQKEGLAGIDSSK